MEKDKMEEWFFKFAAYQPSVHLTVKDFSFTRTIRMSKNKHSESYETKGSAAFTYMHKCKAP